MSPTKSGFEESAVYTEGAADGLDPITIVRMMRAVFELDLAQAKEVIAAAQGVNLSDAQAQMIPAIEALADDDE